MRKVRRAALFTLPFLFACATGPRMTIDKELARWAKPMPFEAETGPKMDARLRFGPYEVYGIEQDAMATVTREEMKSREYAYSYWLSDPSGAMLRATCKTSFQGKATDGGEGATRLACAIEDTTGDKSWSLSVEGVSGGSTMKFGEIVGGKQRFRIQSSHSGSHNGTSARAMETGAVLGFDIYFSDKPVAAVQTSAERIVWVDSTARKEIRLVAATTAAGLMLFESFDR